MLPCFCSNAAAASLPAGLTHLWTQQLNKCASPPPPPQLEEDHGQPGGAGREAEEAAGEAQDPAGGQTAMHPDPDHPGSTFPGTHGQW